MVTNIKEKNFHMDVMIILNYQTIIIKQILIANDDLEPDQASPITIKFDLTSILNVLYP